MRAIEQARLTRGRRIMELTEWALRNNVRDFEILKLEAMSRYAVSEGTAAQYAKTVLYRLFRHAPKPPYD